MADLKASAATVATPVAASLLLASVSGVDRTHTGAALVAYARRFTVVTKTAAYTALVTDDLIRADATTAAFTITLPTAASAFSNGEGEVITVKKIDATANVVTVQGNGAELIDDANTASISSQYSAASFVSNGTSWDIL
jgi:hypothetical protein